MQSVISTNGNHRIFHVDMEIAAIPKPSTLGRIGLTGLVLLRRRRG